MYAYQESPAAFSPVTLRDREILDNRVRAWGLENSEVSFTNLFLWQPGCQISYAFTQDVLLLRFTCKKDDMFLLPPLGASPQEDYRHALEVALGYFKSQNKRVLLRSVTDPMRERIEAVFPGRFVYEHQKDTDDYVYDTAKMVSLSGKKLHGKRNHINKFLATYPDHRFVPYNPSQHKDACLALNERWHEHKDARERFMKSDGNAVERSLTHAGALGLTGAVVFVNDNLEAFTLGERITKDMVLIHMEKANADIQGLYPFINREFLAQMWSDTLYVNREEDMGIENIRKAKLSYYPARMITKYSARLKDQM